jgi:phosphoesterase RecJ-like protein
MKQPDKQTIQDFYKRHDSFVLTTHEGPDPDGIGAEMVLAGVLKKLGKAARIINPAPIPERYAFMDPRGLFEIWDEAKHGELPEKSALIIVDTADEYHIGVIREIFPRFKETFVIDHHEPSKQSSLRGYIDTSSAATCELVMELVETLGVSLDKESASAAYAGIIYDSGSFAYSKTTERTFKAALALVRAGAVPYEAYRQVYESDSTGSLLLQKQVLSSLGIRAQGRVAVQVLRKEDLDFAGAKFEEAESLINIPLKSKNIVVSIMIKENAEGQIRCSLRSKGTVNVSNIAQQFSGGGHATAAGFRSDMNIEKTLEKVLEKVIPALDGS